MSEGDGGGHVDMHTRDRDGSDRQRNESKGMRSGSTVHGHHPVHPHLPDEGAGPWWSTVDAHAAAEEPVDLWRDTSYLRPKWGIYRSIESSGLQNTFQLIRNYKAFQLV